MTLPKAAEVCQCTHLADVHAVIHLDPATEGGYLNVGKCVVKGCGCSEFEAVRGTCPLENPCPVVKGYHECRPKKSKKSKKLRKSKGVKP